MLRHTGLAVAFFFMSLGLGFAIEPTPRWEQPLEGLCGEEAEETEAFVYCCFPDPVLVNLRLALVAAGFGCFVVAVGGESRLQRALRETRLLGRFADPIGARGWVALESWAATLARSPATASMREAIDTASGVDATLEPATCLQLVYALMRESLATALDRLLHVDRALAMFGLCATCAGVLLCAYQIRSAMLGVYWAGSTSFAAIARPVGDGIAALAAGVLIGSGAGLVRLVHRADAASIAALSRCVHRAVVAPRGR